MDKETILKLYRGDIIYQDIPESIVGQRKELQRRMDICQERMKKIIPQEYEEEYFELCGNHYLLDAAMAEETYVQGFMTGLRLAVEALYEE